MHTGIVRWFNAHRASGSYSLNPAEPIVFVHITTMERAGLRGLAEGQKVHYEVVVDSRSGKSSADHIQVAA